MDANKDENIRRMAEFLRQGATMLDKSCPVCSNPLFRLKNTEIYCPSCEKKVLIAKGDENHESLVSQVAQSSLGIEKNPNSAREDQLTQLKQVLTKKIVDMTSLLTEKVSFSNLVQYVDVLYKIVKTLKYLDEPRL